MDRTVTHDTTPASTLATVNTAEFLQHVRGPSPRWRSVGFLALAAVFLGLTAMSWVGHDEYVVVDVLLDGPVQFAIVSVTAVGLGTLGLVCLAPRAWVAAAFVALGVCAAVAATGIAAFGFLLSGGFHPTEHAPNPAGRDYAAVAVEQDVFFEGLFWIVRVRERDGLLSRQWGVICTAERPHLTWNKEGDLVVRADGDTAVFEITPTGRPLNAQSGLDCWTKPARDTRTTAVTGRAAVPPAPH